MQLRFVLGAVGIGILACGGVVFAEEPPPRPIELLDMPASAALEPGIRELQNKQWANARRKLDDAAKSIDRDGPLDDAIVVHALAGRACAELKNKKCAETEHQKVLALWKDPSSGIKRLKSMGGEEKDVVHRMGRVLTAVGESKFFFAEQKRIETEQVTMPTYKGAGNQESVVKFVNTTVAEFIRMKLQMLEQLEKEYRAIVELEPAPPPKWVIASAARVGEMWDGFARSVRAVPIPNEWNRNGTVPNTKLTYQALRDSYYSALDGATLPIRQRSRAAFEVCRRYAVKFQYEDAFSARCAEALKTPAP